MSTTNVEFTPAQALLALQKKIEAITAHLQALRTEAVTIAQSGMVPDAAMQLNDVMQHSEEATINIINAATAIGEISGGSMLDAAQKAEIDTHIGAIYEACSFQDISGQRIKKVLNYLTELETQLCQLGEFAHHSGDAAKKAPLSAEAKLMNGPQLSGQAPDQSAVDSIFGS